MCISFLPSEKKTEHLLGFCLKRYGFDVIVCANKGINMPESLESLYKKLNSDDYICVATGNKCSVATEHFASFRKFVKDLAESGRNQTFITQDENLCITTNCPIWNNTMRHIEAYTKGICARTK